MTLDNLYYYTGASFWMLIAGSVAIIFIYFLWIWFSVAICYWLSHVLADLKYPQGDAVCQKYKTRILWRFRLLALILKKPMTSVNFKGTELNGNLWYCDFRGLIPKYRIKTF